MIRALCAVMIFGQAIASLPLAAQPFGGPSFPGSRRTPPPTGNPALDGEEDEFSAPRRTRSATVTRRAGVPARLPNTPPNLIDLSRHYNASLTESWHPQSNVDPDQSNDLGAIPRGLQNFGGVTFDVRGLIQLAGGAAREWGGAFPERVNGIRVGLAAKKLHFLHSTGWEAQMGEKIGGYIVRYEDGSSEEIPIIYGKDVMDWWAWPRGPLPEPGPEVVWTGSNRASARSGMNVLIFKSSWENPRHDARIASIDYFSAMANPAPFLIAITAELSSVYTPVSHSPARDSKTWLILAFPIVVGLCAYYLTRLALRKQRKVPPPLPK